ncbi:hypothetical protein [Bradyrhizobium sp.]|uniref:hypothetical protein n=1 Tax=Bradyrhizobium sp. TaxID=376 RepID=UPI003C7886D4
MTRATPPFRLPAKLPLDIDRVWDYWKSLKRGENKIPFSDDLKLSALPDLADRLMLVDVFEQPQRFRFSLVGERIRQSYGGDLAGKFADEIDPRSPLKFFIAQASVTVETNAPTFSIDTAPSDGRREAGDARLLLPMWGNGRIEMMLGAVTDASKV